MRRKHVLAAVACTILLTCAGLLFPAIQRTREAAARMRCHSHFKGWTVALHGYASSHDDKFPAGTVSHPDLPPDQRLSWFVAVLPFYEQEHVYKQFDLTRRAGDPVNAKAVSNRFRSMVCPSSGEQSYNDRPAVWRSPTPLTHYVGIAGVGTDAAALPSKNPRAGVFGYDRRVTVKDGVKDGFPDGTSNTLLLIETARDPGHWTYGGFATVRGFEPGAAPYIGEGRPFGGFHGNHWLGTRNCTVAFADSSVRSFTPKTDPALLEALATVAGKEALPAEW
ncbi:MAG: DUF1559 domain-containing protein [Planctomycetes bacterium]|nr:DUF1559 domain-containing protein [Planctomycetota bacterium]